ncbi:FUSC family protein [Micromonospora sp. NPDC005163]
MVRARVWRLRLFGLLALQAGIAAAIAWFVAYRFLGNSSPLFAPTTAVGIVAAAMGTRLRRTIELLAGLILGLAVVDTLMPLFGIGPWQTGVVVVLAIVVAICSRAVAHCSPRPAVPRCSSPPWSRRCVNCPSPASSTPRSGG